MAKDDTPAGRDSLAAKRLAQLLDELAEQGINQAAAARALGVPPQYLSDVRNEHRPMSELFSRRLSDEFNVDHAWLRGVNDSPRRPVFRSSGGLAERISLPLFEVPIAGEPRAHRLWQGAVVDVAGVAAAKAAQAVQPYVLQFQSDDHAGRLRKGDHVLITQALADASELSVVEFRGKLFLARKEGGQWIRAAKAAKLGNNCKEVGRCLGIVWSGLM